MSGFLSIRGVSKDYGAGPALHPLDLEVAAGEFLTLLGPSGCGKTTLLRIVAGLEEPTAGDVLLRGRPLTRQPPERRPFNMVFQSYALFPHMPVAANVGYGLQTAGVGRREQQRRVAAMLELVGLERVARQRVTELSGGQQQRVALARALVNEPEVLLLDEPLAALDLQLRKRLQDELRTIHQRLGTTFIYVTHDQEEALKLSHRVALMCEGRLVQVGAPRDVYDRPRTRFAAEFIGDSNLLEAVVEAVRADAVLVRLPGGEATAELVWGGGPAPAPGDRVVASVRPEHLVAVTDGGAHLTGTIADAVFAGASVRHDVRLPGGEVLRVLTGTDHAWEGQAVALRIVRGVALQT